MAALGEETAPVTDLSNPTVTDKYREAGKIVNFALQAVISQLAPGKSVAELCEFGDAIIEGQASKSYRNAKPKVEKGVAFPTCISVNECVGNYSPLKTDSAVLKAGDTVKIDLGAHIDGYIAVGAHTVVVPAEGATSGAPITGRQADVIAAAYQAAELAVRLIKPGNKNSQVTDGIAKVAAAYEATPLQGVLMHEMKQGIIDGSKVILLRGDEPEVKVDEHEFSLHEVYAIDVVLSTGEGKPRELSARTTVFKLAPESTYRVKLKAAQTLVHDVSRKAGFMPFSVRALGDDKEPRKVSQALLGVGECAKHGVMHPYPVLYEKEGIVLAHFKFTVLLLPSGTLKITGLPQPAVVTDKRVPEDIAAVLATEPFVKGGKKKVEGEGAAAGGAGK